MKTLQKSYLHFLVLIMNHQLANFGGEESLRANLLKALKVGSTLKI